MESATFIADLDAALPVGASDLVSEGDDILRLIKTVLQNTISGFPDAVIMSGVEAQGATTNDYVLTTTPVQTQYSTKSLAVFLATHTNSGAATFALSALSAKDMKQLDGTALPANAIVSGTPVLLVYNGTNYRMLSIPAAVYAPTASPTFTGTPAAPTAAPGTNTTQLATTAFVTALAAAITASEAAAAASAVAAAASASAASGYATTATTQAGTATTQAGNASSSASAASSSASAASASASNASTSESNASASATLASNWATQLSTPVSGGEYSAKYWAQSAASTVTGALHYKGAHDASTATYPGSPTLGDYWKISVAGTISAVSFAVGDSILYNGSSWDKIDSTDAVTSVNGQTGAVTSIAVLTTASVQALNAQLLQGLTTTQLTTLTTAQVSALGTAQVLNISAAQLGTLTTAQVAVLSAANTFTGLQTLSGTALNEARGSVAMHATTMDLWAQPNIIDGTSSAVTITAIANAPQAGARRVLYPVAASIITNGATFAVDGAADHTAAVGDAWEFESITTSTYKVHVTKKDGTSVAPAVGGATETSASANITLTSASTRVQAVTMTTASKSVTLPAATTLSKGGALFIVKNTGSLAFAVRDSAGGLQATLSAGQIVALYLTNNAAAAGTWVVGNESQLAFLTQWLKGTSLAVNAAASTRIACTAMTATTAIVGFVASNVSKAVHLTIDGSTLSAGTVLTVATDDTVGNIRDVDICRMTDTQALMLYPGASGPRVTVKTLDVSGTTLTAGTAFQIMNGVSDDVAICRLADTMGVCVYNYNHSVFRTDTLNISGTTVTAGSSVQVVIASEDTRWHSLAALSSTQAVVIYRAASTFAKACTINVSGTAPSAGAIMTVDSTASDYMSIVPLTSTTALAVWGRSGASMQACVLSISGTTVTANTLLQVVGAAVTDISATALSATKVQVVWKLTSSTYAETCTLTVDGTTVTAGATTTFNSGANNIYNALSRPAQSSSGVIVAQQSTSTYLYAATLEVTP